MLVLDSNVVIAVTNGRPAHARPHLMQALDRGAEVVLPVVVMFELWFGAYNSRKVQQNLDSVREFLAYRVRQLPFDADDAVTAGEIRADLRRRGQPIGPYDVMIAAQALRRDAVLVTANTSEFCRIPGLRCEDWSQQPER